MAAAGTGDGLNAQRPYQRRRGDRKAQRCRYEQGIVTAPALKDWIDPDVSATESIDKRGAVTAQGFERWIEQTSISLVMDRPMDSRVGTAGYSATGKLQMHNITIQKPTDGASPQLVIAALQGTFDETVKIASVTTSAGGMVNFMSLELDNCGISSAHTTGSQTGLPVETYALSFAKIVFTFNNMDQAGKSAPTITGYDLEKATSI